MNPLQQALEAWRGVLGAAHVSVDEVTLRASATATFATSQHVPAVIFPSTTEEVRQCLRVASTHRVPVYPVSGGKNWGYGGRVPVRDGCVLLDLRRMDRVVHFDAVMGTLTVQPGVTFDQAWRFLREQRARFFLAATGGPPQGSLVGNLVERGDGVGPAGDVFAHACDLEVVLPSGECIRTGFGRATRAPVSRLARYGVGPFVDGLFTQSGLGVVTEATFQLAPLPGCFQPWMASIHDEEALGPMVEALRQLRMEDTQRTPVFVWDRGKALATLMQYPFGLTGGRTPLPPDVMEALGKQAGLGCWMATGALYAADAGQAAACRARVTSVLGPRVGSLVFGDAAEDAVDHPLLGQPSSDNLRMLYWRKHAPPTQTPDPDRDGCGFHWVCSAIPLTSADATQASRITRDVCSIHGFESNLAFITMEPRTAYALAAITYDRSRAGEDERARACHDALLREWMSAGYPPIRLGIQSMDRFPVATQEDQAFLRRLKETLDPHGILAPGRYSP
jgi:4-cresol dehydrogenase (hydroxylating)